MTKKAITLTKIALAAGIDLDLLRFIDGRALVVGSTGAGKSYLIRLVCEQIMDQIPTVILDREGEFATLREKHDVVLIGEGGEADTAVATAAKLARVLVELGVSCVINLYDLSKADKRKFVRIFLEALLSLPRSLWRPMVVVVDEAHEFCGESTRDCESREAVIRLMDSGRKRGICGILATQRYQKLSKDAAAEANNVFIGRITLDNDLRRASDSLGFTGKTEWATLRNLDDGEWFGYGQAFDKRGVLRFKANHAKTTHPKPGQRYKLEPPAPSKAILKVAPELAALKQKVAEEKDELTRLREENKALRSTRDKRLPPAPAPARTPAPIDTTAYVLKGRDDVCTMMDKDLAVLAAKITDAKHAIFAVEKTSNDAIRTLHGIRPTPGRLAKANAVVAQHTAATPKNGHATASSADPRPVREQRERIRVAQATGQNNGSDSNPSLGRGGERRMLVALAQHPDGLDRTPLGLFASVAVSGGSFGTYLSNLKGRGWIAIDRQKRITITEEGLAALGDFDPLPEGRAVVDYWLGWVNQGGERRMLQAIIDAGEEGIDRETLGQISGVSPTGGSFGTYLSNLKGALLIDYGRGSKIITASPTLLGA